MDNYARTLSALMLSILALLSFSPIQGFACAWDADTIRDEKAVDPSLYDLVMGRFPHHSNAYYDLRLKQLGALDALSFSQKNDKAVALMRLERFRSAEKLFLELYKEKKGSAYEINSNLAVLYKKGRNYALSSYYLEKALRLKPEGHMGLGDWYLKRINYDLKHPEGNIPEKNFLGEPYKEMDFTKGYHVTDVEYQKAELLKKLIINDRAFPDSYLVLGDLLFQMKSYRMALRSYFRAQQLNHKNPKEVLRRISATIDTLNKKNKTTEKNRTTLESETQRFDNETAYVEKWNTHFVDTETTLVNDGQLPDFTTTQLNMTDKKIYPHGLLPVRRKDGNIFK